MSTKTSLPDMAASITWSLWAREAHREEDIARRRIRSEGSMQWLREHLYLACFGRGGMLGNTTDIHLLCVLAEGEVKTYSIRLHAACLARHSVGSTSCQRLEIAHASVKYTLMPQARARQILNAIIV